MLVHPTENVNLLKGAKTNCVFAVDFPEAETNMLCGGAEDGSVFLAHIHGSRGGTTFEGHNGPVSGVDFHPTHEGQPLDFSDLMLSSSFDWTVKLWSPRQAQSALHTFESGEDYVCEVAWSPTHPGVFATVDAEGMVDVWNLVHDFETPVVRAKATTSDRGEPAALNSLDWSHDGKLIYTGDLTGRIHVWTASSGLVTARNDDWNVLQEKIEELKSIEERDRTRSDARQEYSER
eukprot:GHVU01067843.1.p2 GENE.GHVU01067843.1~~GHVU01067843.1.p2  ORF type:complete len:234 (-),score=56.26 GHVU01067843.1:175-876(-)